MSLEINEQTNVTLQTARRYESGSRWSDASRVYLKVILDNPKSIDPDHNQEALEGLERCTQYVMQRDTQHYMSLDVSPTEAHTSPLQRAVADPPLQISQMLLVLGYLCHGQWSRALHTLGSLPTRARSLSPVTAQRWSTMLARLQASLDTSPREGVTQVDQPLDGSVDPMVDSAVYTRAGHSQLSSAARIDWIVVLVAVEKITAQGHIDEVLLMCRRALHHIKEPIHRALIHYESGRIGVNHGDYKQGAEALTAALTLTQNLKGEVLETLDSVISQVPELTSELDTLVQLRCEYSSDPQIEHWIHHQLTIPSQSAVQRGLELGASLERISGFSLERSPELDIVDKIWVMRLKSAAFLCYAVTLNDLPDVASSLPEQEHARSELFERLTRLALSRNYDDRHELEEDEPTIDSEHILRTQGAQFVPELIEEGENRLLLQLRELGLFQFIERFFSRKASAHHLTTVERARAFNSLAQIAFSVRSDLREAVEQIWRGAQLHPHELKVATLIKEAQRLDDWISLERLLLVQLKLTKSANGRETVRRALAQGYRRAQDWFKSYEMLIELGCDTASRDVTLAQDESHLTSLERVLGDSTERLISSLLRVKGAAVAIGDELIFARKWAGLLRLVERLQWRGEVAVRLLIGGVKRSDQSALFAKPLATLYAREERWSDWVGLIVDAPRSSWSISEWGPLIDDALSRSSDWAPELKARLLQARAEWIGEDGGTLEDQLHAWRVYLEEHPADLNALESFTECVRELNAWTEFGDEVVTVYERALPLRKVGKLKILETLAELYEVHLKRPKETAHSWRRLLDLSPQDDRAGEWLTLYYSQRRDWYQLLLICALWDSKDQYNPLWIESKVRAHIGLRELEEAYFWWDQLEESRRQANFIEPLFTLAITQESGEITLDLLQRSLEVDVGLSAGDEVHRYDRYTYGLSQDLSGSSKDAKGLKGSEERSSSWDRGHLSSLDGSNDTSNDYYNQSEISLERSSESTMSERDELISPLSSALGRLRIKARALGWLNPPDEIGALKLWEQLRRSAPRDSEMITALARLYVNAHKLTELLELTRVIDQSRELVLRHRRTMIEVALYLETRFTSYTEAFKCWLALYEHSSLDHKLCLQSFERLATYDSELGLLLCELYKLLVNHASFTSERCLYLGKLSETLYHHQKWDVACEYLEREFTVQISNEEDALDRVVEYATPLGAWEWASRISASLGGWRAALLTAEIVETRLGDRAQALIYYEEALIRLNKHLTESVLHTQHAQRQTLILMQAQISDSIRRLSPLLSALPTSSLVP